MDATPHPPGPLCTRESIAGELRNLGLKEGDIILLHSSLRSIGWVCGGAEAVVLALLETEINSDPANWKPYLGGPVPEECHETIRASMPALNSKTTPSRLMGAIAETVRTWPGAVRSASPQSSFAAIGPLAEHLTADHPLDCRLGEDSPIAKPEKLDAKVLLLGVDFNKCTCFHLAEYRTDQPRGPVSFAAVTANGEREWMTVDDVLLNGRGFDTLGDDFEEAREVQTGRVGAALSRMFALKDAVAFAEQWFLVHRPRNKPRNGKAS